MDPRYGFYCSWLVHTGRQAHGKQTGGCNIWSTQSHPCPSGGEACSYAHAGFWSTMQIWTRFSGILQHISRSQSICPCPLTSPMSNPHPPGSWNQAGFSFWGTHRQLKSRLIISHPKLLERVPAWFEVSVNNRKWRTNFRWRSERLPFENHLILKCFQWHKKSEQTLLRSTRMIMELLDVLLKKKKFWI